MCCVKLYDAKRKGGPTMRLACRAHGRRKFFDLARFSKAPIPAEAVKRIDVLFAIERKISGLAPQERLRAPGALPPPDRRARGMVTRTARPPLQGQRYEKGDQLLPQPLGCVHPLSSRQAPAHVEQCRRTRASRVVGRINWTFAASDEGGRVRLQSNASSHRNSGDLIATRSPGARKAL